MAQDDDRIAPQPTSVEMAKIGLTGMITSCSGVLIALYAYSSQTKTFEGCDRTYLALSGVFAGLALWFSLLTAFVGYLHEGHFAIGAPVQFLWWAALVLFFMCWILLGLALLFGGLLLL